MNPGNGNPDKITGGMLMARVIIISPLRGSAHINTTFYNKVTPFGVGVVEMLVKMGDTEIIKPPIIF